MSSTFTLSDFQEENFNAQDTANLLIDKILHDENFSAIEKFNLGDINKKIEAALKNLDYLKEEIIADMENINLENELNHSSLENEQSKMIQDLDLIKREFDSLEVKLIKFSDKSINLGNQLSSVDKVKDASLLTMTLLDYF
jgi:hypothetical protein